MSYIQTEDRDRVRWLTLSAPARRNAVPLGQWEALAEAFVDFENSDLRVLVLRGDGADFCSGADLGEGFVPSESAAENLEQMRRAAGAPYRLHRLSKPTVAAVDGVAAGGGLNLALGCDVIIATTRARFSEIFVRRGLTMDLGGTWLLPRVVGLARAREIALTGRIVEAPEALAIGLVTRVVEPEDLGRAANDVAVALAAGAPMAQRFVKAALDRSSGMTFEQALAFENQAQSILLGSHDVSEGIASFTEKRAPKFEGR